MKYNIGDSVTTKKKHPCGGDEWEIIGVGVNIKIKCKKCGHIVVIGLDKFPKAVKKHVPKEI